MAGTQKEWTDLIEALTLLARGQSDNSSPFHCEHDVLTVMSDPDEFTEEELARLSALGFDAGPDDGTFSSFRYGAA
jgi:hypothetical protein